MSYLDKISDFCEQRKMSKSRLAREAGLSAGLIFRWFSGETIPRMDSLQKVADYMCTTIEELMSSDDADNYRHNTASGSFPYSPDAVSDRSDKYVPLYRNLDPSASSLEPASIEPYHVAMPDSLSDPDLYFAYIMNDSGMLPDIHPGDTVIVRKDSNPVSGDLVLVSSPGEDTICRKLILEPNCMILQPFNPHYDAKVYWLSELDLLPVFIRGIVVTAIHTVHSSANYEPEE